MHLCIPVGVLEYLYRFVLKMMQCILVMNAYFPPIGQWNPCYKGISPDHIIQKLRGRFLELVILKVGGLGPSVANKRHRVYTCALLATPTSTYTMRVESRQYWWYA